jgi:hypothetical protein
VLKSAGTKADRAAFNGSVARIGAVGRTVLSAETLVLEQEATLMIRSSTRRATLGAAALGLLASLAAPAYAAGPFASFEGNWTGSGTVSVANGSKERLRCRAHYDVGGDGNSMSQNLTCASDSYKFNIISHVTSDGSSISGDWAETTRNANGHITGKITPTQISAYVSGLGFTARIGIAARGGRQSVTLDPTGTDIRNVSVTMAKG